MPCTIEYLLSFFLSIYGWIIKLKINTHQLIAHWKTRLSGSSDLDDNRQGQITLTGVNVAEIDHNHDDLERVAVVSAPIRIRDSPSLSSTDYGSNIYNSSQQQGGSKHQVKTPRFRRSKFFSLLRRLSPRNLMDYCVIALNEASGSASSNKFDLSSCTTTIWLLGRQYSMPNDCDQLIGDIRSKLWITYRKNFPPIDENTRYTSDRGFGCMIRCGQMVLANALLHKNLGRDWRWSPNGLETNPLVYSKILKLFQDREDCPYSIHRIIQTGQQEGKSVGEWFGPNTIAQALKRISSRYSETKVIDKDILISIDAALDNMVVIDEIKSKFKCSPQLDDGKITDGDSGKDELSDIWTPGILFIQLRLGLTKINPLYFTALRKTFQFHNSLGIIGGRPNHALYLVGYTEDDIIYLDPHSTQQYVDFNEIPHQVEEIYQQQVDGQSTLNEQSTPDSTYHCSCPEKMPIDRLDPSLALCFYFDSENEFDDWCRLSQDSLVRSEQAPMFEITKSRPSDWEVSLTTRTISKSSSELDEEFEILS